MVRDNRSYLKLREEGKGNDGEFRQNNPESRDRVTVVD